MPRSTAPLFRPFSLKGLALPNRIVMAPMTRKRSPGGVPGPEVAAYYRRRAEGGTGLIVTEGTYIAHPTAGPERNIPRIDATPAVQEGWRRVVDEVHAAGGHIFSQLWHVGLAIVASGPEVDPEAPRAGPSGIDVNGEQVGQPMTEAEISDAITAYGDSAEIAHRLGFDGIEIHAAHGYLIDEFFWERTNRRADFYGGDMVARTRFGAEVVGECRRRTAPDYPIGFRFSQWKIADYKAVLAPTPDDLDRFLAPLVDAGVDIFHASTRRFWEPAFPGSDLNLAGWTKKLSGRPAIAVGSVGLAADLDEGAKQAMPDDLDQLVDCLERDEFDLVAVGRAGLANPDWPEIVRSGDFTRLKPFDRAEVDRVLY